MVDVGSIIGSYNYGSLFTMFGFGGIPRHMGISTTQFCFPVNGNPQNPLVGGV
jgi:hypothetical protein